MYCLRSQRDNRVVDLDELRSGVCSGTFSVLKSAPSGDTGLASGLLPQVASSSYVSLRVTCLCIASHVVTVFAYFLLLLQFSSGPEIRMRDRRNAYRIFVGKPEGKRNSRYGIDRKLLRCTVCCKLTASVYVEWLGSRRRC